MSAPPRRRPPRVPVPLTIAGSDPTGGAGVEADLKVFLAHGWSGAALITALTGQDTRGVDDVAAVAPARLRTRYERLRRDLALGGAKTGLLPGARTVRNVAAMLKDAPLPFLVVDPVIAPTRGAPFLDRDGRRALLERLFPLADLVTPNVDEAALLLGTTKRRVRAAPDRAALALRETGARAVLVKGGHGTGADAIDVLHDGAALRVFRGARVRSAAGRAHGTGCALSAAIVARLMLGDPLAGAIASAKNYVHRALLAARPVGRGRWQLGFTSTLRGSVARVREE